jgi:hypothetical protein
MAKPSGKSGDSPRANNAEMKPWHDKDTLAEMYWDEEMSHQEIADEFGVSRAAIQKRFRRYDIETRDPPGAPRKYSDDELLEWIDVFVAEMGVVPSVNDIRGGWPGPSPMVYSQRFGTFTEAVREAGYTPRGDRDG